MKRCELKILYTILIIALSVSFPAITAESIQLNLGETIQYDNLELSFYDIEDSRCPLDVMCVWEGQVLVMVNISNDTDTIPARFTPGHTVSYITPYNVTLTDIRPHPITTEKSEYTATLEIVNTKELILPDTSPIRDYDYQLIYAVVGMIVSGIIGSVVFVVVRKKRRH